MFFDFSAYSYYLKPGDTDMRKGSQTLSALVTEQMHLDPFSKSMFLFCGKSHKILIVLVWDNGFWIMKKKLNRGTFVWPKDEKEAMKITLEDLKRLLSGQDVFRRIPELGRNWRI